MTGGALNGRRALVTGASRGIGAGIAEELARRGAHVLVHYVEREADAAQVLARIRKVGSDGRLIQADLRDSDAIGRVADAAGDLDILVNNVGTSRGQSISGTTEENFDLVFDTNVKAPFFLTQAVLDRLQDGGAIVNISSMVSMVAYPKTISYSMTKAAVNAFTRSLAAELAPRGIRVNAVAPGATRTELLDRMTPEALAATIASVPLGRVAEPWDIAQVVAFLVSPEGGWITGQVIQASGGMHI